MEWRISIHRKIMDRWRYSDANTFSTFIHCLLKANIQDKTRQWNDIKRGSFISSIWNLSDEVWITRKQMLLVLERLEKGWEIVTKRDNKKTLFIVVKYNDYQWEELRKGQQKNIKSTSKEHQRDTTKEDKKERSKEINDFQEFKQKWNSVPEFWVAKKWLPKIVVDNPTLIDEYKKKRKIYTFEQIRLWLQNYCRYMEDVPKDDKWFYKHRFTAIEFLGRKLWLDKYINMEIPD